MAPSSELILSSNIRYGRNLGFDGYLYMLNELMMEMNNENIQQHDTNEQQATAASAESEEVIEKEDVFLSCHCQTEINIKEYTYTWNITPFWKISRLLSSLDSSKIEGQPFQFRMRISHQKPKLKFYCFKDKYTTMEAIMCIYLKTTEGQKFVAWRMVNISSTIKKKGLFLYEMCMLELDREKSKYVPNDTLTICFKVRELHNTFHNIMFNTNTLHYDKFLNEISDSLVDFSAEPTIVTLITKDGEKLQVNKSLVCKRSEFFKAMFYSDLKEAKTNEANVDITFNALKLVISFIQTGIPPDPDLDEQTLSELFKAANKYCLFNDLVPICEHYLIKRITHENVIKFLKLADLNNACNLEKQTTNYIRLYLEDIANTSEFAKAIVDNPRLLTKIMKEGDILKQKANYKF